MTHPEFSRWNETFSGENYFYGAGPGPIARRAVRYHRPLLPCGGMALDAGAGEGQDLLFLAQCGYRATGVEWTPAGADKARRLTESVVEAEVVEADLLDWKPSHLYDLVIAVNCLQFMGQEAPRMLKKVISYTAPGGVCAISVFGREPGEQALDSTVHRWTLEELMEAFAGWQPFEATRLWQWGTRGAQPFVTIIAGRL